jgi:transcriptional regulator with XRE-family HTH domain
MLGSAFGRYLRAQRNAAGLSLRDVAARMNITHVYLGEVERGVRGPLDKKHWDNLLTVIPGITRADLERQASLTKPIQINISDAPPLYQDLALNLARRIQRRDIPKNTLEKLLVLLRNGLDSS